MALQVYDNVFRTTVICVDKYENRILSGRLYNSYYKTGINFGSTMELLRSLEGMLEEMNCPQSFSSKRLFRPIGEKTVFEASTETEHKGKLATFSLRILFRQNASWQGSVVWSEGKQEESYRSVLELLLLIDSALVST